MSDTSPKIPNATKQHKLALDYSSFKSIVSCFVFSSTPLLFLTDSHLNALYVIKNKDNLGQVYPVWKEILDIAKTKKVDWNRKGAEMKMNKFGTDLFNNLMNEKKTANYQKIIYVNK